MLRLLEGHGERSPPPNWLCCQDVTGGHPSGRNASTSTATMPHAEIWHPHCCCAAGMLPGLAGTSPPSYPSPPPGHHDQLTSCMGIFYCCGSPNKSVNTSGQVIISEKGMESSLKQKMRQNITPTCFSVRERHRESSKLLGYRQK